MSPGRFFIGFLLGGIAMYAASRFTSDPEPEQVLMSIKASPEGPRVPTRALTSEQVEISKQPSARARLADPLSESTAEAPHAVLVTPPAVSDSAPSEAEMLSRLVLLGVSEGQAREAIEKLGTVKVAAILEKQLAKTKAKSPPSTAGDAGSVAPVVTTESEPEAEPAKDPYEDLTISYAANPPFQNEEELAAYRKDRFNSYLEKVKNAEEELFTNNENGLACAGENCLPAH